MLVAVRNEPLHRRDTFGQRIEDGLLGLLAGQIREKALHDIGP